MLYDVNSVGLAAFLGGFLGGALLIFQNERALGRPAGHILAIGVAATFGLVLAGMFLPEQIPGIVYTIATIFACRAWAETTHGPEVAEALLEEGRRYSNWRAAGMGLLMLIPTFFIVMGVVFVLVMLGM